MCVWFTAPGRKAGASFLYSMVWKLQCIRYRKISIMGLMDRIQVAFAGRQVANHTHKKSLRGCLGLYSN
jgi:hypothetical protein